MSQDLRPGDFLVFQLESGFGLLRLLAKTEHNGDIAWHLETYENLFFDVDSAEAHQKGGWNRDSLKPGDAITVQGISARDGSRQAWGATS